MQVSKTFDYAVRSLTFMGNEPISKFRMKQISKEQHIPLNYLAKVMRKLVNKGIVDSKVGPDGGYTLTKSPSEINLRDVYEAIEGEMKVIDCMETTDVICALYQSCPQIPVWDKLNLSLSKTLQGITIGDMLAARV